MSKFAVFRKILRYIQLRKFRGVVDFSKHYFGGLWKRIDDNHLFLAGAGLSYSLLISLIPIILLVFSILSNVFEVGQLQEIFRKLIDGLIPYPEFAKYVNERIVSRLQSFIEYKTSAWYIGSVGLFFTATWLFSSMRTVLNTIFGVSEEKSAWMGLLRDFGMVILLIFLVLFAVVVIPLLNILATASEYFPMLKQFSFMDNFLLEVVSYILIFILFYIFYYLIPYEKIGKIVPAISSLWATFLWGVMKSIFGYYVYNVLMINKIYGPFLLIAVLAFWVFYSSVLFVLGAEIGQLYREWKAKQKAGEIGSSERLKRMKSNMTVIINMKDPEKPTME